MDRWDGIGASGTGLVVAGVYGLAGWPVAAIFLGTVLLALYVTRELRFGGRR